VKSGLFTSEYRRSARDWSWLIASFSILSVIQVEAGVKMQSTSTSFPATAAVFSPPPAEKPSSLAFSADLLKQRAGSFADTGLQNSPRSFGDQLNCAILMESSLGGCL
jgi:hypothetical protein